MLHNVIRLILYEAIVEIFFLLLTSTKNGLIGKQFNELEIFTSYEKLDNFL